MADEGEGDEGTENGPISSEDRSSSPGGGPDLSEASSEGEDGAGEPAGRSPGLVPTRVCRKCSASAQTSELRCPYCDSSYLRGTSRFSRKSKVLTGAGIAAVIVVAGATAGVKAKVDHDRQVAAETKARQVAAARAARERKAEEEAKARARVARILRDGSIKELERSITKDAKGRVAEGTLDGPILFTQCQPVAEAAATMYEDDATDFDCLAVTERVGGGQVQGYSFQATMNWKKGNYTWQLGSA